jgi:membrane protein DedA with SNARE-associated domain
VFFGRFLLGLRVWASWLAGATHMRWRSFVFWNAAGGICWATAIGLLAYFVGHSASGALQAFGLFGLLAVLLAVIGLLIAHRRGHLRERRSTTATPGKPDPPAVSLTDGSSSAGDQHED